MKAASVFTHRRVEETAPAIRELIAAARRAGVVLLFDEDETRKHKLTPGAGIELNVARIDDVELCIVMGGDGTILTALRHYAGTGVPVFAINYGAIGFLSTVEPWELEDGFRRALRGEFDAMELPGLLAATEGGDRIAINDVSFHRRQEGRVAELAYSVEAEQLGEVRCDGLVVSTPAGSTGYNLANGGPVLAWGVEGFVVSFIAPHTLTARALVVAPGDTLEVTNRSRSEEVDVTTDARRICALAPQATMRIQFKQRQSLLAQTPGASFYHRLRDKFGRLSH